MAGYALILSCEHGGNDIPPQFEHLFKNRQKVLNSHRGWDPGTLDLAQALSSTLDIPLVSCTISRLLIEMNRSLDHPQLFSEYSAHLSKEEQQFLLNSIYLPYRDKIEKIIHAQLGNDQISLHFSIHSFTPVLKGIVREVDLGILFDPDRPLELIIADELKSTLQDLLPDLKIKMNLPYQGTDDGLTTYLRSKINATKYSGIEIEINQKWIKSPDMGIITNALIESLALFKNRKPAIY